VDVLLSAVDCRASSRQGSQKCSNKRPRKATNQAVNSLAHALLVTLKSSYNDPQGSETLVLLVKSLFAISSYSVLCGNRFNCGKYSHSISIKYVHPASLFFI
jgi:hypothetical protein